MKKRRKTSFTHKLTSYIFATVLLTSLIFFTATAVSDISSKIDSINSSLDSVARYLSFGTSMIKSLDSGAMTENCEKLVNDLVAEYDVIDGICIVSSEGNLVYQTSGFPHPAKENLSEAVTFSYPEQVVAKLDQINGSTYRCVVTQVFKDGRLLGYITIHSAHVRQYASLISELPVLALSLLLILFTAVGIALAFNASLKRMLSGYNIDQYVMLYERGVDILNIMDEGILTVNRKGRITYMNMYARSFLELPEQTSADEGSYYISDIFPDSRLMETLRTGQSLYKEHYVIKGHHLISTQVPLYADGRIVGAMAMFHSAFLINEMAEQLETKNSLIDSLRAYNHEFMNSLHVILGFLETGRIEEAKQFLIDGSMRSSNQISSITRYIENPVISAILIGKVLRAEEMGIDISLTPGSYCTDITESVSSNFYVSVIGNLIENAIEELNMHNLPEKEIQVTLYIDSKQTYISILDTGTGIPDEIKEKILENGFSTKGEGRGNGLYLIQRLVKNQNGTLRIESEEGEGSEFIVSIDKTQRQ